MNGLLNLLHVGLDNIDYLSILALVFLASLALCAAILNQLSRKGLTSKELARIKPEDEKEKPKSSLLEKEEEGFTAKVAKPLHDIIAPKEDNTRKKLRLKLTQAGYRSEKAVRYFLASKVTLALLLPGIVAISYMMYSPTPMAIVLLLALAAIGFFIPDGILYAITDARQTGMRRSLPDALDLMVVCVESGLGLDMTFNRVGEEIRSLNKELSDEFYLTNLESKAGRPRTECLKNMATRTGIAEIHNLMTILIQSSRFGTSLGRALRVHAEAMRVKRRQLAEEKAAKAVVKLLFPLILCIFPAIFVVLVGPAGIRIIESLFPHF